MKKINIIITFSLISLYVFGKGSYLPSIHDQSAEISEINEMGINANALNVNSIMDSASFLTLKAKIADLDNNYIDCGFQTYTICLDGILLGSSEIIQYGESVLLYITCPEIYNELAKNDQYLIKVIDYSFSDYDGDIIIKNSNSIDSSAVNKTKFRVVDIIPTN